MNDAGLRIRNRRIELGMTQDELAAKVGYKSKVSICKLETERDLPIKKLKPIADALDISVAELMGWDDIHDFKFSNVNTDALASAVTDDVSNQIMIEVHKMNAPEREELLNYIRFLMSKRNKEG